MTKNRLYWNMWNVYRELSGNLGDGLKDESGGPWWNQGLFKWIGESNIFIKMKKLWSRFD